MSTNPATSSSSSSRPTPPTTATAAPPGIPASSSTTLVHDNKATLKKKQQGCLTVTILSVYDLPRRDPPDAVVLTLPHHLSTPPQRSGPPNARHKDKNSFKFTEHNVMEVVAPLDQLYHTHATLTLHYAGDYHPTTGAGAGGGGGNKRSTTTYASAVSSTQLQATIPLSSLKIRESNWLILNLEAPHATTTMPSSTLTTTSTTPANNSNNNNNNKNTTHTNHIPVLPPTIRLQVQLMGPYRREIAFIMSILHAWFGMMDPLETHVVRKVAPILPNTWHAVSSIPTIPLIAVILMTSPVWIWSMPLVLPIVTVVGVCGAMVALVMSVIYLSSADGREHVGGLLAPLVNTLLSNPSGQRLVYETGPRPTPVSICRAILPTDHMWYMLVLSVMIDAIGSSSYLLPVLGEGFDLAWAPMQTILIMAMYDHDTSRRATLALNNHGNSSNSKNNTDFRSWSGLKYLSFVEEILPFTDVIPSATIGWYIRFGPELWKVLHHGGDKSLDLLLGDGKNNSKGVVHGKNNNHNNNTTSPNIITPFNTPATAANF